jgi:hypothetical protein
MSEDVFATAADAGYGYHLVNLLGSVKANSPIFDRLVAFDLGMTDHQRTLVDAIPGVERRVVPPFSPHWSQCFTWKPWAWMQLSGERVFWLDAGSTVLRSLGRALDQVSELGYFLVSQGNELRDIVPPDYFARYGVPEDVAERPYVAAGILGFRPGGDFFERVLAPTYEDCLAGHNLGFSPGEVAARNRSISRMQSPPVRDCRHFRWDQTILNVHLALAAPHAQVADLDEYGGWRGPHDHPEQVIWNHRRSGNLRYLKRVPYAGPSAWRFRLWGAWWQVRWLLKPHKRFVQPMTYLLKARAIGRTLTGRALS